MEQSPSSVANSHSASQEITYFLWNPKVHYHVYKSSPLFLSWARFIQSTSHPIFIRSILILFSHLRLDFLVLPSLVFLTKILYAFLISYMRAKWNAKQNMYTQAIII